MKGGVDNQRYIDLLLPHPSKERHNHSAACLSNSVGDPDPLVRGMDPDPDLPFSHKNVERNEIMPAK